MYQVLLVIYLLVSVSIIFLVLVQQGSGVDWGGSFGAGTSSTLFGAMGGSTFISRTTTVLAGLFFCLSLLLGNLSTTRMEQAPWQNLSEPVLPKQPVEVTTAS